MTSVVECFPDLFSPQLVVTPAVASDIDYDGDNLACVNFSGGDTLETIIENIDDAICDIKNNLLKSIPTSDVTVYDGVPTFSCFSFTGSPPTLNDVIDQLGLQICINNAQLGALEGNDIIYQGPTIDNVPGVTTGDDFDDIIAAIDDIIGTIADDTNLIPDIILSLGDLTDSWVVSGGDVASTSGLTVDLDGATYNVDGTRVVKGAEAGIVLTATKDNYLDISAAGVYTVTTVVISDPPPAVVGLRLFKFETDGSSVVGTTDLRNVWPINGSQIVDTTITGAKMVANTITTTQLDVLIGSPGETLQANVTVDASGRITAIDTDFNLNVAPSDGDAITFDTGTGKWISGDISSTFFPPGAENDTMRLDGTGAWLASSLLTNNTTSIGVGTSTPDGSAIFDVVSTTQGIGNANMDENDRDSIASPKSGLLIYNTDTNKLNHFNGTVWLSIETSAVAADSLSTVLGVGSTSGANNITMDKLGVAASAATQKGSQQIKYEASLWTGAAESVVTFDTKILPSLTVQEEAFWTISFITENLLQIRQDGAMFVNMGTTAPFGNAAITAIQNADGSGGGLVLVSTSGSNNDISLSATAEDMMFGSQAAINYVYGTKTGTTNARALVMETAATLPGAEPEDAFQMYSKDWTGPGTATVHFRNEEGDVMNLHQEAAITTVQELADALTTMGLLASSTMEDGIPDITNDVIPRGTGTTIEDGTWTNVGNDIIPLVNESNVGSATKRIGTLFMASNIDYTSDLLFVNSATKMTLTTAGLLGVGVTPANESLELSGAILLGTATATTDGTVRWTGTDFEGRKAGSWISFTMGGSVETLTTTLAAGAVTGANDITWSVTGVPAVSAATQLGSRKGIYENTLWDGAAQARDFEIYSNASTTVQEETFLRFDYDGSTLMSLMQNGNLSIGNAGESFGTSAVNVFMIGTGTAPSSEITNTVRIYTTTGLDLIIRDETGTTKDLFAAASVNSIYNANDTIGAGRVLTLTDTVNFTGGDFGLGITPTANLHVEGDGTGTGVMILFQDDNQVLRLKLLDSGNFTLVTGGNASFDITAASVFRQSSAGVNPLEIYDNSAALLLRVNSSGLFQFTTGGSNSFDVTAAAIFRASSGGVTPFQINIFGGANHFFMQTTGNIGVGGQTTPLEDMHALDTIRADQRFNVAGNDGIDAVTPVLYTIGGGGTGDLATITVTGGIITARTIVP